MPLVQPRGTAGRYYSNSNIITIGLSKYVCITLPNNSHLTPTIWYVDVFFKKLYLLSKTTRPIIIGILTRQLVCSLRSDVRVDTSLQLRNN